MQGFIDFISELWMELVELLMDFIGFVVLPILLFVILLGIIGIAADSWVGA